MKTLFKRTYKTHKQVIALTVNHIGNIGLIQTLLSGKHYSQIRQKADSQIFKQHH